MRGFATVRPGCSKSSLAGRGLGPSSLRAGPLLPWPPLTEARPAGRRSSCLARNSWGLAWAGPEWAFSFPCPWTRGVCPWGRWLADCPCLREPCPPCGRGALAGAACAGFLAGALAGAIDSRSRAMNFRSMIWMKGPQSPRSRVFAIPLSAGFHRRIAARTPRGEREACIVRIRRTAASEMTCGLFRLYRSPRRGYPDRRLLDSRLAVYCPAP
jgi:hypothetical protein